MAQNSTQVESQAQSQVESAQPVESKPTRNAVVKALRHAHPAVQLTSGHVLVATGPKVVRKPGSKAARCVEFYKLGATVGAIVASMPLELQSYGRACLVWDYQHGPEYATFEAPAPVAK